MTGRATGSQGAALPGPRLASRADARSAQGPTLLIAVLVLVLGILGMHVLSVGHHAPTTAHAAPGGEAAKHDVGGQDARATHPHPSTGESVAAAEIVDLECGPGCSDGLVSTGASCMAALTLLLFLGRPRHLTRPTDRRPRRRDQLVHLIALWSSRAPLRPPSLTALCILRI